MPKFLWTQRSNFGPSARSFHGAAYDSNRRRVVLFGGFQNQAVTLLGDTWEWDGSYWTQMDDIGPAPRSQHAMAFDSNHQATLLFGGGVDGPIANDTWQWDGEGWTQLADSGPSPRFLHALAFDSGRNRTVLFGGLSSGGALQDTWEFDGAEWTQQEDAGPPARGRHVMAYDAAGQRVLLFGGNPFRSDTWAWDGKAWTQLSEFGPPGRENAGMAGLPDGTVLFGGSAAANVLGDSWQFDGKLWTQRQDIGPGARLSHTLVFDSDRNRVVLFGGSSNTGNSDPLVLLADTWEHQVDQASPPPPVSVASLQIVPNQAKTGDSVAATLTLSGPAPTPSIVQVTLEDPSGQKVTLPGVNIPAGMATFTSTIVVPDLGLPGLQVPITISVQIAGTPPATATFIYLGDGTAP
jgi:hypothetical protein